jgi:hypothetical protein
MTRRRRRYLPYLVLAGPVLILLLPIGAIMLSTASPNAGDRRISDVLAMAVLLFMFGLLGGLVLWLERHHVS